MKNTEQKEILIKKLKLIESVHCSKWNIVLSIIKHLSNSSIIENTWTNYKSDIPGIYPPDLFQIKTWSTYKQCISLEFITSIDKLICDAQIYDGNIIGESKIPRFRAKIELPMAFISELKDIIEREFDDYAEEMYEAFLYSEKRKWIENFKKSI